MARWLSLLLLLFALSLAFTRPTSIRADTNAHVAQVLTSHDVYISPHEQGTVHVRPGDLVRLKRAVQAAQRKGVHEKIAILGHYPRSAHSPGEAAVLLEQYIGLNGVLVLVSPKGMGVGSPDLSPSQTTLIARRSSSRCAISYARCAIYAGITAIPYVNSNRESTKRSVLTFWLVVGGVLLLVSLALVFNAFRIRRRLLLLLSQRPGERLELPLGDRNRMGELKDHPEP